MAATASLLNDKFFQSAVGYAKSVARDRNDDKLTPLTLLAGLLVAARHKTRDKSAKLVLHQQTKIEKLLKAAGIKSSGRAFDHVDTKMPLSDNLREAIKSDDGTLEKLISTLIKLASPLSIGENKMLLIVGPYIPAYLAKSGLLEVTGDVFAAASFSAYEAGKFGEFPGLSSLFAANRQYFLALVEKAFDGLRGVNPSKKALPVLSADLSKALREGDSESERALAALDLGLTRGAKIVSDRATAYHEAGHAIASSVLRPEIPVSRIQVKLEKNSLGATYFDGTSPHWKRRRREDFLIELCICLAGRAAQYMKFGDDQMDEGASSDLEDATLRAWKSISHYGLDPEFGPINLFTLSDKTGINSGWLFDEAQKRLQVVMKEAVDKTEKILAENWLKLEAIATALIAKGEVDFEEFVGKLKSEGLTEVPGAVRAVSIPVERQVRFATQSGSLETAEGTVRHDAGDAIVTGESNESWPVSHATFVTLYKPLGRTKMGEDGLYQKIEKSVLALPIKNSARLDMSEGRGLLFGKTGDWIVDYGHADLAIVADGTFNKSYRVL
jgi:hypothetical protein